MAASRGGLIGNSSGLQWTTDGEIDDGEPGGAAPIAASLPNVAPGAIGRGGSRYQAPLHETANLYREKTVPCGFARPEKPCGQVLPVSVTPVVVLPASRKRESSESAPVAGSTSTM